MSPFQKFCRRIVAALFPSSPAARQRPSNYPVMKAYKPSAVSMRYTQCWKADDCLAHPDCPLFTTCGQIGRIRITHPTDTR